MKAEDIAIPGAPRDGGQPEPSRAEAAAARAAARAEAAERETFFRLMPTPACVVGFDGVFHQVNPAFAASLGREEEDLLQRRFATILHPDDFDGVARAMQTLVSGGRVQSLATRFLHAEGGYRLFLWDARVQGKHILAAGQDVTDLYLSQEMEARLKVVLDRSPDFIGISDVSGRPLYWNAAYRRLRGIGLFEPLPPGLHVKETHTEGSARQLLEVAIPTALKEGMWEGESCYRDPQGNEIPVSQVLMVHRGAEGEPAFLSSVARDISTYRIHDDALKEGSRMLSRALGALRQSEARYRILVEASPDIIARHGPDGRFVDVNPALERVLGYSREFSLGRMPTEFVEEEDVPAMQDFFRDLRAGRDRGSVRFRVRSRDGRQIWLESRGARLEDAGGRVEEVVITSRDVSDQLELERLKGLFLSTASHELRTPLASIRASLELLADGSAGPLPERAADMVSLAHANAVRLARIVDDMLDMERVKQGRMAFVPKACRLDQLARQAVEAVRSFSDSFGVALPLGPWREDAEVFADPDRVVQILVNLISNAVKYSPAGGPVLTRIEPCALGWAVEVEDRGPGIPEAFRPRIFEQFSQAGGPHQQAGSGLGLSISRSFAEAMGGALDYDSHPGRTVFRLELPVPRTGAAPEPGGLPAILHVEDDAAVSQLLAAALDGVAGLVNVSTLEAARARLAERPWALAILDSHLPDGDGQALLPDLKALPGGSVRVVLFTGDDTVPGSDPAVVHVFVKGDSGPGEIRRVVQRLLAQS